MTNDGSAAVCVGLHGRAGGCAPATESSVACREPISGLEGTRDCPTDDDMVSSPVLCLCAAANGLQGRCDCCAMPATTAKGLAAAGGPCCTAAKGLGGLASAFGELAGAGAGAGCCTEPARYIAEVLTCAADPDPERCCCRLSCRPACACAEPKGFAYMPVFEHAGLCVSAAAAPASDAAKMPGSQAAASSHACTAENGLNGLSTALPGEAGKYSCTMLPPQLALLGCSPSLLLPPLCKDPSRVPQLSRRSLLPLCARDCCGPAMLTPGGPPELRRWCTRPAPAMSAALRSGASSASCRPAMPYVKAVGLPMVLGVRVGPSLLGVRAGAPGDTGPGAAPSALAAATPAKAGGRGMAKLISCWPPSAPGKLALPLRVLLQLPLLVLLSLVGADPPTTCIRPGVLELSPPNSPVPAGVPGSEDAAPRRRSQASPLPASVDGRLPIADAAASAAAPAAAAAASAMGPHSRPLLGALLMLLPGAEAASELPPPKQLPVGVPGASE
jgi:hypothetical protein